MQLDGFENGNFTEGFTLFGGEELHMLWSETILSTVGGGLKVTGDHGELPRIFRIPKAIRRGVHGT